MKLLKLAAGVLNQLPLDWVGNGERIVSAIREARAAGVTLLCLPELAITGYGCEDAFHSPGTHAYAWRVLQEKVLPETGGMIVAVGLPVFFQNGVFNCAALVVGGRIAGFVAKRFLAGDGIHYEPRWFKPWPTGVVETLERDGQTYPIGDLHFDVGGVKIGFEICEDAWVAQRPGRDLTAAGVDIILNPSASHFAFGKIETRKRFVLEGSRAFGVTYVYTNLLGNEAGRAIYDGGGFIAAGGSLLAMGSRFSYRDVQLVAAVADLDLTRTNQLRSGSFFPSIRTDHHTRVSVAFEFPACDWEAPHIVGAAWETSARVKEEEFTRAVCLALFDYLRKSRSAGFVVSLSGGVDSAAVATLVATMVELAVRELGRDAFVGKLAHIRALEGAQTVAEMTRVLLTCVYQVTRNSSETTRLAARSMANALHAVFLEFDVERLVGEYVEMVGKALQRPLTWERDDVALQNIQARVRSPGVWMLANVNNALLLSTSNRSEAAVGYATMDGDTSGGLAPIAGIDKAFLRQWGRWMQEVGVVHPIPAWEQVNVQLPTAELRPAAAGQTDEDDLMPYVLLDAIERAAIRDKQTPVEVFTRVREAFGQYSDDQLLVWVGRFFRLWSRNQWKRERYAPSFHLDDENLDPKTWCRFPILSGGFEQEIADLEWHVAALKKLAR